jgi:hypothetical protein
MKRLLDVPRALARRLRSFLLRPLADDLARQHQALAGLQARAELLDLHLENLTREVVRLQLQFEALEEAREAGRGGTPRADRAA